MTTSTVRIVFHGDTGSATRAVGSLDRGFSGLARTAKVAAAAIGTGFAVALGAAVKAAIDFDKEMRNVNSIAKLSEKQFKGLSKQVLSLSKETAQSPKTLAKGMYDIVSSGFKASAALKILRVSAIAATAGMTDTATASKAVVAVLNAYQLGAEKAGNVSSLLFKEVQLGVNTFEELATNIGDTAPLAAALKIPFSDVAAGLALITKHGTSMAEASTQMGRVMADLLKPSKELKATLKGMGYESGQAAIQAHGFVPLIKQLSNAAGDSATKTSDWFANIRSLRGMLNLTGPNLKEFEKFAKDMAASFRDGGDDIAAFNEQSKSIAVQWAKAKAALIAAAIPLGTILFPALSRSADALADFAGWITKINEAPELGPKLGIIGDGFRNLADDAQKAFDRILHGYDEIFRGGEGGRIRRMPGLGEQIAEAFAQIDWTQAGNAIVAGISDALRASAELAKSLAAAVTEAIRRVDWVAAGRLLGPGLATALVVAFATLTDPAFWVKNWDLALAVGLAVFGGSVGRLAGRLGAILARPFVRIGSLAGRALADGLETAVLAIATRLPSALSGIFLRGVALAGRALGLLGGLAARAAEAILEKFQAGWNRIGPFFRFTLRVLGITAAIDAVADFGSRAVHSIGNLAGGAVDKLGALLGKVPGWMRTAFDIGPIGRVIGAVQRVVDLVQWLLKQAGKIIRLGVSINFPSPPSWFGRLNPFRRASGGFIPHLPGSVSGTDSVPAMLTPGEIVLNRGQQEALGGPRFLSQLFGFSGDRGTHFAAGGIVPKAGTRGSPARRRYPHRSPRTRPYSKVTKAARFAFRAAEAVGRRISDLDRSYGQLQREFSISPEEPIAYDADGNEILNSAAISKHLNEIGRLIIHRQRMLALLDEEKAKLEEAIEALRKAIAELMAEMNRERDAAEADARQAREFAQALKVAEREEGDLRSQKPKTTKAKKERDAAVRRSEREQDRLRGRIEGSRKSEQKHLNRRRGLNTIKGDLASNIETARSLMHDVPFDRRDVNLDVMELMQEAREWSDYRAQPGSGGGGGGEGGGEGGDGGGGGPGGIDEEALRRLGLGRLAAAIEIAQLKVIGSFQKGTIHVPQTGLALVHAGERITPAGVANVNAETGPVIVQISSNDSLLGELLSRAIDVGVVRNADAMNLRMGSDADRRRREGRYG